MDEGVGGEDENESERRKDIDQPKDPVARSGVHRRLSALPNTLCIKPIHIEEIAAALRNSEDAAA